MSRETTPRGASYRRYSDRASKVWIAMRRENAMAEEDIYAVGYSATQESRRFEFEDLDCRGAEVGRGREK